MLSDWWYDWKEVWKFHWALLWTDVKYWLQYTFWWNRSERDRYWGYVKSDMVTIATDIRNLAEHYANEAVRDFEAWVFDVLGIREKPRVNFTTQISNLWGSIVALWATFGPNLLTGRYTVESWVQERLALVWGSITALWAKFGYEISNGSYTVVSWVRAQLKGINDSTVALWAKFGYEISNSEFTVVSWVRWKLNGVYDTFDKFWDMFGNEIVWSGYTVAQWVRLRYDTARTQAQEAKTWLTHYGNYYAYVFDYYRDVLQNFLQDPGAFLGPYIEAYLKGTVEKPGPGWFLSLLRFLLNPIGAILDWLKAMHALVAAWLIEWFQENTPTDATLIGELAHTDTLIPTRETFLDRLFTPVTAEDLAFDSLLDQWAIWVSEDLAEDHPYLLPVPAVPGI